ncbi:LysR family transcriptional regulator [Alkalilimnicola ehrlichii]|uniref:HTH-type transcriptional regulator MetR n=1 Tax=Alkalilimnicola ehrlichii TaxID=351052 RepID=A0A3E0X198_9GAMM|nr:LysR family transcriptional regulator [Alkalilimnicola ehrlichii]RFA31462.1 LysR family transcriptional regulator [Alkalilimnicola ehrlichii]RFA39267.1 LysR family transcriptional regulator [Alkalilimnicola ehrlichii]
MFLELRHLKSLQAIREAGSLAAAADRLHLTQSALSHQIKSLENYFDTMLFFRKTRPLRFTPAGERLLTLADEVLPRVETLEHNLRRMGAGERGRLHVALECHSCFDWLLPTLNRYRGQWPDVELDLSMGFSFHPLPALYRGDIDAVITSDPEEDFGGVSYSPLFRYEVLLAVPHQHRLAEGGSITPQDLSDETLLTYPVCRSRLDVFSRFLTPAGVEPAQVRSAELTVMLLQLVASGRGVAALPNWALHEAMDPAQVKTLALGEEGLWSTLYVAVREEDRNKPYIDAFIEQAKATSINTLKGIQAL